MSFELVFPYAPSGDQPQAIKELTAGLEKGERYQTLLGATGTGKSISYHDPVYVLDKANPYLRANTPIGPLTDELFKEYKNSIKLEGESEVLYPTEIAKEYFTQAIDPGTGKEMLLPIKSFVRHVAAEMYEVETVCGRTVTATSGHNFWVMRNGRITLIETQDMRSTDLLPIPMTLLSLHNLEKIDVIPYMGDERVYAYIDHDVESNSFNKCPARPREELGIPKVKDSYEMPVVRRNSKRGVLLKNWMNYLKNNAEYTQPKYRIAGRKVGNSIPSSIALTPDFLYMVGVYVAEGNCQDRTVTFTNSESACVQRLQRGLEELGLTTKKDGIDYHVNSKAFTLLMRNTCGANSYKKRLPPFWNSLSNESLGHLLRGYYDGDGGVEKDSSVKVTTASIKLSEDLLYALSRFSIWARKKTVYKKTPGLISHKKPYSQVILSGQENLNIFSQSIGFELKRKQALLEKLNTRNANSNRDLIFGCGNMVRECRRALGITRKELGSKSKVKAGSLKSIEQGLRNPQRSTFIKIVTTLGEVARDSADVQPIQLEDLRKQLSLRWVPVKTIKLLNYSESHVYDLSVPGAETFLSGTGIFVHNTLTMAHVIAKHNRPAIIMSHNKTLAAQLYAEMKQLFPKNAVEYFISYYDYYQPEAYIPSTDTYIEKDASINDDIERLRLKSTASLLEREDVIIVTSVSCIYGLGDPEAYRSLMFTLEKGQKKKRKEILESLVAMQYVRNDIVFQRGGFRVRGDSVDIFPAYEEQGIRVELWGDEIERIVRFEPLTGETIAVIDKMSIFPARHFVTQRPTIERAVVTIEEELKRRVKQLLGEGRILEAQRLESRTRFDIEMMLETGICQGIENYSRHLTGRESGERPACLLDYFPKDFLLLVDESHVTVPQISGMYNGDRARKMSLVDHGFRLPSALDNRPLKFNEWEDMVGQAIFVSATPGRYELDKTRNKFVEQIIRPTGLLDPEVEIKPVNGQIDDLMEEVQKRVALHERVLVTTLTKKMSEDLAKYLTSVGIKVRYLHSEIDSIERVEILRQLRLGEIDVIIGINLLREGLDLPEVSLVAILDADKEGFLRSTSALIQTVGRAARNVQGKAILYADKVTRSMQSMIEEMERRRSVQAEHNRAHGITPRTIVKSVETIALSTKVADARLTKRIDGSKKKSLAQQMAEESNTNEFESVEVDLEKLEREMKRAAAELDFETAAKLRDRYMALKAI